MAQRHKASDHERYLAWLEELHGGLSTPDEVIDETVERAVGSRPVKRERIVLGEVNEVYRAATLGGDRVIVRVNRSPGRHRAEAWAIERCREAGVPVPEVLLVEEKEIDGQEISICIQRRIDAVPLDHLLAESPVDEIHRLVEEGGRLLSRIHSVTTEGSGYLGADGHGTASRSVTAEVLAVEDSLDSIHASAAKVGVEAHVVDTLMDGLRRNAPVFDEVEPRLVHGDYGGKHLLVDEGQIVGVIDFENCASFDPAADFAWWEFWYEPSVPVEVLIRGYRQEGDLGEGFALRRRLLKVRLTLGILPYLAGSDHPAIHHWFRNLEDDLAWISSNG